jgi:hypothetical protein
MMLPMRKENTLLLLLLAVAVIQILTIPRFYYDGDNYTTRAEAINLVNTGQIGIPYHDREDLKKLVEVRGQYFFENDSRRRFFSKYGIGLTLAQLPPILVEKVLTPELRLLQRTDSLLLFMNLYHVFFALVSAFYLYVIAALYTRSELNRVAFVLLSIYGTFLWHYLRAPAHEIYQVPLFLALGFHFLAFLRIRSAPRPGWGHLAAAMGALFGLILMKSFYLLILPVVWVFTFVCLPGNSTSVQAAWKSNCVKHRKPLISCLLAPTVITLAVLFGVNAYKFGSIFESGYGQWFNESGIQADRFSPAFFLKRIRQYVMQSGNWNVWVHYPMILIALLGIQRFVKKHRVDALFVYVIVLVVFVPICCFSTVGAWCYGPRLLLLALILGALPFLEVLQWIREGWNIKSTGMAILCLGVLGISLKLQINVNSLDYFAHQECRAVFHTLEIEEVDRYFDGTVHRGLVCGDLLAFRSGSSTFFPLEMMAAHMMEKEGATPLLQSMYASGEENLRLLLGLNYYFLPR